MTTKYSSPYFSSNSDGGNKLVGKRRRAAKTVQHTADSDTRGHGDGLSVDADAESTRPQRGKRQSTETAKEAVKRRARKKKVEAKTEMDVPDPDLLQSVCCTDKDLAEFVPEVACDENNNASSSDSEWEEVAGRGFRLCIL